MDGDRTKLKAEIVRLLKESIAIETDIDRFNILQTLRLSSEVLSKFSRVTSQGKSRCQP